MESSIINNTMAVQIPILAVVFLGERLNGREVTGLLVAIVGALLVQLGRKPKRLTQRRRDAES
jgi:drug/metabolite transporter (DMT)-like permease